jgi:hypothetical protein
VTPKPTFGANIISPAVSVRFDSMPFPNGVWRASGTSADTWYGIAVAEATEVSLDWLVAGRWWQQQRSDRHPVKVNGRPFLRFVGAG